MRCAGDTQEGYCQPLERAEIARAGSDVTILCYSRMRYVVMQACQQLEKDGFNPEVSIAPHEAASSIIAIEQTCSPLHQHVGPAPLPRAALCGTPSHPVISVWIGIAPAIFIDSSS